METFVKNFVPTFEFSDKTIATLKKTLEALADLILYQLEAILSVFDTQYLRK